MMMLTMTNLGLDLADRPYSTAKRNINALWQDAMETTAVAGWTSFRRIWKESCPKIQICQPCNDTCGECSIFQNAFRYRQAHQKSTTASDSDSDSNIDNEDEYDDNGGIVKDVIPEEMEASEENISVLAKSFLAGEEYGTGLIIEVAGHHVLQSKSIGGLIQFKTKLAIESVIDEKDHTNHGQVMVCDFAQNLPAPNFGGEQPGEIYYLPSLTIKSFGIVNISTAPNKLTCYIYKESTTKKDSNNVLSPRHLKIVG
jgi:hypothetical protein